MPRDDFALSCYSSKIYWVYSFCSSLYSLNTLRPRQNGRHFADDIFKWIFLNKNVWIPIKISLKFVPQGPINNIPALVQIMAWRRPGDKPLSEPMMFSLPTHICVTRPQWVNLFQSIVSRAMGRRSMHYMCSKCPFRCQRRTEFNCHTKTHRLKLSTQRLRRLEGRPDYLASPSTLNIDAYSANLQSASEGTASVCNPTNAAIRLDNEAIANRNTGPKSTMLEQPSVMKPDERNALTAERGDSLLGDMWLQAANKCDSSLEIALPSRDAIRSVYRPDIAEIWKVADKLVVSVQGTKKCSICPYKSATPLQCIEEHVGAIHLGIKRWLCSLCAYNDNKRVHIIEHIQTQHAGKKCSAILCKNIYKSTYNGILDNSAQNLQFRRLGDVEAYVLAKHIKENTGQLSKVFQVCVGEASELSMGLLPDT